MAQLQRLQRHNNSTPKTPKSPTVEQFLQGEASAWSGTASPTLLRDHDPEFDHPQHHQKQSVLNKVKERARRWRHSLSKKKHSDTVNTTPSWGVSLEEEDLGEEDPEYLGAPMYESEVAPEGYKETGRPHLRTTPAVPEKHVTRSTVGNYPEQDKETENPPSPSPPNKTLTSTVTAKLAPAYNAVSDATTTIASKIQNISVSAPTQASPSASTSSPASAPVTTEHSPEFYDAPVSAPAKVSGTAESTGSGKQMWDKGVSVKEYLMQKLEPGEDEKALSQVISDAMSPRRAPGDAGVVEKVKEAVTSLLRKEESSSLVIVHSGKNSMSQIPVSTNPQEVAEGDSHGRVVQTN
ncbi:low-temperature-induced 65 kDa protein [Punica granatum]|uniref:Low-temperature-induced 65 kDa protein n=2 Tax=Punica granatum TaxID=22663 RepID=A0A6P8DS69_PUNGR|nr:low-temperature-induced 65 kDa protein [Punica granatum]PKI35258.1 hypothetical protein CRG98_044349 [Punica granatum]